jgi:predicted DNA-binding transcriptional regulator YafY
VFPLSQHDRLSRESKPERVIWPIAIAFFERVRVVVAWCELQQAFRHFRTDRITSAELTGERLPRRRPQLLTEWREAERVAEAAV